MTTEQASPLMIAAATPTALGRRFARRALPATLVIIWAIAAQASVLPLDFRHDDCNIIRDVDVLLGRCRGAPVGQGEGAAAPGGFGGLFRPTYWLMIAGVRATQHAPYTAPPFYLAGLILHGITALMVWLVARALLGSRGAFVAALAFGAWPAGSQALAWIAAQGDVLAVLFLCVGAWVITAFAPSRLSVLLAGMLAALAAGAKESGFIGAPLLALLLLAHHGKARWRLASMILIPTAALAAWRAHCTGDVIPRYHSPAVHGIGATLAHLADLDAWRSLYTQCLVPWNLSPDAASVRPFLAMLAEHTGIAAGSAQRALAAAMTLLLIAPAFVMRPRAAALLMVLTAAVSVPAQYVWIPETGTGQSRDFYVIMVPLVVLAGLGLTTVATGAAGRLVRGLSTIGWIIFAICTADAYLHTVRYHRLVAAASAARVTSLEALATTRPPSTAFIAADPQVRFAEQYTLGPTIYDRLRPPFRTEAIDIRLVAELSATTRMFLLTAGVVPVQFVCWEHDRLTPVLDLLDAPSETPSALTLISATPKEATFVPPERLTPRSIGELALELPPGGPASLHLTLRAGAHTAEVVRSIEGTTSRRSVRFPVWADAELLSEPAVSSVVVKVEGSRGVDAGSISLTALPPPPFIQPLFPSDQATLQPSRLRFELPWAEGPPRAELWLATQSGTYEVTLRATFEGDQCEARGASTILLDPARAGSWSGSVNLGDWAAISQALTAAAGRQANGFPLWWRVVIMPMHGDRPGASTSWHQIRVVN